MVYIPLSVQVPDYYKQLQHQQTTYTSYQAWWPSQKTSTPSTLTPDHSQKDSTSAAPTLIRRPHVPTSLQEDLLNAITSPLTPQDEVPSCYAEPIPPVKTSDTHPLKFVATCRVSAFKLTPS